MKASGVPESLLDEIGEVLTWPATHEQVVAASKLVPDEIVQMITASGTPDECRAKVAEYVRRRLHLPDPVPARRRRRGHDRRVRRMGSMNDHRQLVSSGGPYELIVGYSRAVRVGDRIFVAGTAPQWPDGQVDPSPTVQARRCFEIIEAALREAGATLADVVRTRIFLIEANDFDEIGAVHGELFAETRPANTTLVVKALLDPAWKVEIEVEADRRRCGSERWPTSWSAAADLVATMDDERRELAGGWVAVTDGFVSGVGGPSRRRCPTADACSTPTGCLVTPGLINTHHHIYQNLTRSYRPAVERHAVRVADDALPALGRARRGGRVRVGVDRAGRARARRVHDVAPTTSTCTRAAAAT